MHTTRQTLIPNWSSAAHSGQLPIQAQVSWEVPTPLNLTIDFAVPHWPHPNSTESAQFKTEHCHNWGLWNYDVVEAFWQLRRTPDDLTAPYLEVQISPRGQRFSLIIVQPRRQYFSPLHFDFSGSSTCNTTGWQAQLQVDLSICQKRCYLGPGHLLYGQLAACLGGHYASTQTPWPVPADFHRPELFLKFGS